MIKLNYISKVMGIMNEPGLADLNGNSFTGADAVGIDRLIESSFIDAWRRIAKVAPRIWLGNKSFKTSTTTTDGGNILTASIYAAGTGHSVFDDITIVSNGGESAIIKVLTIGTDGAVATFEIISQGTKYAIFSGTGKLQSNSTGTGINFSLKIDSIGAPITSINYPPIPSITEGTGYVVLPDDFYLLTRFKMATWKVPAMEAAVTNTRVANLQANEWTRGSSMRPSVVIDNIDIGGLIKPALRYYSLQKGLTTHTVEEAIYVPTPVDLKDLNDLDEIEIGHQIIEPLCYLNAATVFTILEKPTIAAALEVRAEAILPGVLSLKGTNATVKQ